MFDFKKKKPPLFVNKLKYCHPKSHLRRKIYLDFVIIINKMWVVEFDLQST